MKNAVCPFQPQKAFDSLSTIASSKETIGIVSLLYTLDITRNGCVTRGNLIILSFPMILPLTTSHGLKKLSPPPDFFKSRIEMFDKYKTEYDELIKSTQILLLPSSTHKLTRLIQASLVKRSKSHYQMVQKGQERAG